VLSGSKLGVKLNELKDELDKEFGKGNWVIRKVSRVSKKGNYPSLTISAELSDLGINPNDFVIVGIRDNEIVIRKV